MGAATLEIEFRPLGHSGVELARVALGCGNFGGVGSAPEYFGRGLSADRALALMDAAWALGITHFDTADAYGGARSEEAHDFDPSVPLADTLGAFDALRATGRISPASTVAASRSRPDRA